MHGSLLGRIARYGVSGLRDPREDRLTEILAALLDADACRGLARHVAVGWLAAAADDPRTRDRERFTAMREVLAAGDGWACSVSTQASFQSAAGSRRPDLMLRFQASSTPREPVLWVEIKHGSPPHTRQL